MQEDARAAAYPLDLDAYATYAIIASVWER